MAVRDVRGWLTSLPRGDTPYVLEFFGSTRDWGPIYGRVRRHFRTRQAMEHYERRLLRLPRMR